MGLRERFPAAKAFVVGPAAFAGTLDSAAEHHLRRATRLRPGDYVLVGDGAGSVRLGELGSGAELEWQGDVVAVSGPTVITTVGFSLLKGDRNDLVVQKLTEVGVDVIQPLVASRTVVRWSEQQRLHHAKRWVEIARGAVQQAWRPVLPTVAPVVDAADYAVPVGAARSDLDGDPHAPAGSTLLVGPEGGWSEGEFGSLPRVGLGPYTMRAETAAIAAGVALSLWRLSSKSNL